VPQRSIAARDPEAARERRTAAKRPLQMLLGDGSIFGHNAQEPVFGRRDTQKRAKAAACLDDPAGCIRAEYADGERVVESAKLVVGRGKGIARIQQIALIATSIGRVEDRHPDEGRLVLGVTFFDSVDEHRNRAAVLGDQLERDLIEEPLKAQQWREMSLEIDLASDVEQFLETPPPQVIGIMTGPGEESRVDPVNSAIGRKGEIAAGGVLVEVFKFRHAELRLDGRKRFVRAHLKRSGNCGSRRSLQWARSGWGNGLKRPG
jgi:hypothetical protein